MPGLPLKRMLSKLKSDRRSNTTETLACLHSLKYSFSSQQPNLARRTSLQGPFMVRTGSSNCMTMELTFDLSIDLEKPQFMFRSIDCECAQKKFQIRVGQLRVCSLPRLPLYKIMQHPLLYLSQL
jgi:hypothetical protein